MCRRQRQHRTRAPKLASIVRSAYGCRPTSANAERGFSHGRKLVEPSRASMGDRRVENWMLNKLNKL